MPLSAESGYQPHSSERLLSAACEVRPHCRASVIVPARNEEAILPRTLDALREQRDLENAPLPLDGFEVLLLLNNCSDGSVRVAEAYQKAHPAFALHVAVQTFALEHSFVGTARRLLMDEAYARLHGRAGCAILSTDADTVVAPDWIARNLAELHHGAEVVGGVIHLFPDELQELERTDPGVHAAYRRDREFQRLVARLEALLDPDPADPWPRHLEHFGASLACTPEVYARCGGMPAVRHLEDVAFIDELRKVGARLRHSPDVHIFTSARLDGRAEVGLSGQLRHWQDECARNVPHRVDSAIWLEHRFRSLRALRVWNEGSGSGSLTTFPEGWRLRLKQLHADHLPTPRFLEYLDCNRLIEEMFAGRGPRHAEIAKVLGDLEQRIKALTGTPKVHSRKAPALVGAGAVAG